jgi:hypothetical protein
MRKARPVKLQNEEFFGRTDEDGRTGDPDPRGIPKPVGRPVGIVTRAGPKKQVQRVEPEEFVKGVT